MALVWSIAPHGCAVKVRNEGFLLFLHKTLPWCFWFALRMVLCYNRCNGPATGDVRDNAGQVSNKKMRKKLLTTRTTSETRTDMVSVPTRPQVGIIAASTLFAPLPRARRSQLRARRGQVTKLLLATFVVSLFGFSGSALATTGTATQVTLPSGATSAAAVSNPYIDHRSIACDTSGSCFAGGKL